MFGAIVLGSYNRFDSSIQTIRKWLAGNVANHLEANLYFPIKLYVNNNQKKAFIF